MARGPHRGACTFGWWAGLGLLLAGCALDDPTHGWGTADGEPAEREIEVVARTPHLATYPCGQCHDDREPDPTPRALTEFHGGRRVEHGPALRWCDDCHDIDQPSRLRLRAGGSVGFDASDRVCGQCHGEKHRDWSAGLHGLQTGGWRGTVQRRLCTACHDPHVTGAIELEALPAPLPDPRVGGHP